MGVVQSIMSVQKRVNNCSCWWKAVDVVDVEEQSRRDRYLKARRRVVTCVRAAPRRAFLSYDAPRSLSRSQLFVPYLRIKLLL